LDGANSRALFSFLLDIDNPYVNATLPPFTVELISNNKRKKNICLYRHNMDSFIFFFVVVARIGLVSAELARLSNSTDVQFFIEILSQVKFESVCLLIFSLNNDVCVRTKG
jgi:hypothetical protein